MRTGLTAWAGRPGDGPPAARSIHMLLAMVSPTALMLPKPARHRALGDELGDVTGQRSAPTPFGRKDRTFEAMGAKSFRRH